MKVNIVLFCAFLFVLLSACEDEVIYPKVTTEGVTAVTVTDFVVKGTVVTRGDIPVLEYGFVYGEGNNPDVDMNYYNKVSLGKDPKDRSFEAKISYQRSNYYSGNLYVRAYLTNQKGTVYGDVVLVDVPVLSVDYITPAARVGEEVVIKGTNFSVDVSKNIVTFSNVQAVVKKASLTELVVEVPSGISGSYWNDYSNIQVSVSAGGQTVSLQSFRLLPTATSFAPLSGSFGTTITVYGSYFSSYSTSVLIGGQSAYIYTINASSFSFVVPSSVSGDKLKIQLVTNGVITEVPGEFTMQEAAITNFSPMTAVTGTLVGIQGTGFNPEYSGNTVYFGNIQAVVDHGTSTLLYVKVPDGLLPGSYPISVNTGANTAISPSNFTLTSPTITDFNPKAGTQGTFFTISGTFGDSWGTVLLGDTPVSVYSWNNTSIKVYIGGDVPDGVQTITVNTGGQSVVSASTFTVQ